MSQWWSFATQAGVLTGQQAFCAPADLAHCTPDACFAVEGRHDHLCRRVDLDTGDVVPWQPPAPADDEWRTWAWDAEAERWLPTPTLAAAKRDRIVPVQAAIEALEAQQARPLREISVALAAGQALPAVAVARVAQIDGDIAELRSVRSAMADAADAQALAAIEWP